MQDNTHPTALEQALATIGLSDLLTDFVAHERVGCRYTEISRAAEKFGYGFKHEHGNVYGKLRLEPLDPTPTPVLWIITRSDVAAVYGSKRRAA